LTRRISLVFFDHPAQKDAEVGDGTTSVVLLAVKILKQMKPFVEEGVHPQIIMRNIRLAAGIAVKKVRDLAVTFDVDTPEGEAMLLKTCSTALNSKLIASHQDLFAPMIVDAVRSLAAHGPDGLDDLKGMIGIKKISGGDVRSSFLVKGVAFKKTFSYAGFEQMTKKFANPKILLLNVELELQNEKEEGERRGPHRRSRHVPEHRRRRVAGHIRQARLVRELRREHRAQPAAHRRPGDAVLRRPRPLLRRPRVEDGDMKRVAKATGATVQTSTNGIYDGVLGTCAVFEETRVGDERFNIFTGCPNSLTSRWCSAVDWSSSSPRASAASTTP
jgi:T-complex protein 1 subunit eta